MLVHVVFDIHSWWHAGTGRGAGAELDATVYRTPGGLPCLPGRTVKGLLREATTLAERAGAIPPGRAEAWFGTALQPQGNAERERQLEEIRFRTEAGSLTVGTAVLGSDGPSRAAWEGWAAQHPLERSPLFSSFASTRIDERGVAAEKTLRAIEVVVPLTLCAPIEGPEDGQWAREMQEVLPLVRALGSHRHRGLGRVSVRMEGLA